MIPQAASARISARGQPTGLWPRAAPPCAACGWLAALQAVLSIARQGTVQGEPGDLLYHLRASHAVTPPERPQKRAQGGACAPGRPGRAQVHCVRTAGARGGGARRRGRRLPGRPNPTLSLDANAQVHCVPAAGPVAAELRGVAGGFPAGLTQP